MVNEGILTGLSVEAIPKKSARTVEGIVERIKAHLENVALCRGGRAAYADLLRCWRSERAWRLHPRNPSRTFPNPTSRSPIPREPTTSTRRLREWASSQWSGVQS